MPASLRLGQCDNGDHMEMRIRITIATLFKPVLCLTAFLSFVHSGLVVDTPEYKQAIALSEQGTLAIFLLIDLHEIAGLTRDAVSLLINVLQDKPASHVDIIGSLVRILIFQSIFKRKTGFPDNR